MARTVHRLARAVRHEQILAVAEPLFARLGFEGTTTRRIAERAGINEALLFRHFPTKEKLYWAVIQNKCRRDPRREELEKKLSATGHDPELFRAIAEEILRHSAEDPGMFRLLLHTGLENHRLARQFFESFLAEGYDLLAAGIRQRIEAGTFRNVDPLLAARSFIGMVIYHVLIQEVFGGKHYQNFDPQHVSETLTDIWLEGMKVPSAPNMAERTMKPFGTAFRPSNRRARRDGGSVLDEVSKGQ